VLMHIIVDISSVQMNEFWWNRRVISLLRQYLLLFTLIQQQKTTTTSTVKFIKTTAAPVAVSIVTDTEKYSKEADLKSKPNRRISMPGRCKDFSLAITPRHFLQPNHYTRL